MATDSSGGDGTDVPTNEARGENLLLVDNSRKRLRESKGERVVKMEEYARVFSNLMVKQP